MQEQHNCENPDFEKMQKTNQPGMADLSCKNSTAHQQQHDSVSVGKQYN